MLELGLKCSIDQLLDSFWLKKGLFREVIDVEVVWIDNCNTSSLDC